MKQNIEIKHITKLLSTAFYEHNQLLFIQKYLNILEEINNVGFNNQIIKRGPLI